MAADVDVEKTDRAELRKYIDDMFETMKHADGVGLAAPQVGDSRRILVVDGNDIADVYPYLKGFRRAMINPEVLEESEETADYSEGCLSVPDIHCNVVRPKKIKVRYYDADLNVVEEELDEFACRMVQHEMDGPARDGPSGRSSLRGQGGAHPPQDDSCQAAQHSQGQGPHRVQNQTRKIKWEHFMHTTSADAGTWTLTAILSTRWDISFRNFSAAVRWR